MARGKFPGTEFDGVVLGTTRRADVEDRSQTFRTKSGGHRGTVGGVWFAPATSCRGSTTEFRFFVQWSPLPHCTKLRKKLSGLSWPARHR